MTFTKEQQKKALIVLVALVVLLNGYRYFTAEPPKTAPLTYARGAVASSPVRQGLLSRTAGADTLSVLLERREEKYPGVSRDIFRMDLPAPRSKPVVTAPVIPVISTPVSTPVATVQAIPEKTPEEIAAELAKVDLSKFRFLGYLTDKDNTLFLSKEGELFMVKSGERILGNYRIKEATKDHVVLLDTVTRVEVRVELSGSEQTPPAQPAQQRPR